MARPPFAALLNQQGRHALGKSLFLLVRGGSKLFEYRFRDGARVVSKFLGSAADGPLQMSLTDARVARDKAYVERKTGVTRKARAVAAGKTFAAGLDEWLDANPNGLVPGSVEDRRVLASTSLAEMDIGKITQADVLTALANETPRQHADKRGWLRDFFSHAKKMQWRSGDNPAEFDADTRRGFAKVKKGVNHHAALDWHDLPSVYKQLPDTEAGNAVRFQILNAARPGEVRNATWSQIIRDNGHGLAWEYTVLKGNTPFSHRVPLTAEALALLGKRGADDAKLFSSLSKNMMQDTFKKVAHGMSVHGTARSTFKQWCDDSAVEDTLSETALSHYRGDTVHRAYSRGDLFNRRRELMEKWAAFAGIEGSQPRR